MGDDGGDFSLESLELEDVYLALVRQEAEGAAGRTAAVVGEDSGERGEGVIRAEGLVRDFGDFRAVDHVDLQVGAGEVFGLLGANGAGKTTVIRMLIGLLAPTEGQSSVAGVDMARARGAQRNAMGYMSQVFSLYGDLTVAENLETAAGVYGFSRKDAGRRRDELLDACGLREQAGDLAGETPLGFRQRLALGCSVVHEPRALFLDEPTSGVDPAGRRRIWEIVIRAAREGGVAVLVTTHSMTEALRCDRVGLMHAGRIKTAGSPEELKRDLVRQAGRPVSVVTDKPMQALPALKERGYREASLFGEAVRVLVRDEKEQQRRIREVLEEQGFEVRSVAVESPTMEDVFAHHMLANQLANQEDAS
ncbi:MAG: ATP-binding cassette domain-containing protein [Desulfovibrionaceae bacterium]